MRIRTRGIDWLGLTVKICVIGDNLLLSSYCQKQRA